ncbi:MFS transporter [Pseudonocardia sp. TRM90224]|uniref:MFS transporter n=1 Tax=Pseudonocardia sp. TRM90224 TaxID=2812678 RepID=UPI001E330080|nr:MFS transporter [Pseudonocardia sp. TRM90224]
MSTSTVRTGIMSRPLAAVFAANFGALVSFYLLLSTIPMFTGVVGAGEAGAGLTTGVMMLATVTAEFATAWLVSRIGYRTAFGLGLVLLGAPALLLPLASDLTAVLLICLARGVGFAIVVVVAGAVAASLMPAERRGEGLGLYGIVAGIPAIVALPAGIWLVAQVGYTAVFVGGGLAALAGIAALRWVPAVIGNGSGNDEGSNEESSLGSALRSPGLRRPALIFAATATAAGITATFLPLAVGEIAAIALLGQSVTATVARWLAGRYGDRHGPARLLVPGVLAVAVGTGALLVGSPVATVAGMLLFGAGFGVAQSASMMIMYNRAPATAYGTVSALWNLGYDAGYGAGAAGFGAVAGAGGYPVAFGLTTAIVVAALLPALRDRRHPVR